MTDYDEIAERTLSAILEIEAREHIDKYATEALQGHYALLERIDRDRT